MRHSLVAPSGTETLDDSIKQQITPNVRLFNVIFRLSQSSRVPVPLEVTGECLVNLLCMGDAFVGLLVKQRFASGSSWGGRGEIL